MSIPVCSGGSVTAGASSIAFSNSSGSTVYITSCTFPGFPVVAPPGYPVPNGGATVPLSARGPNGGGPWSYSTSGGCTGSNLPIRVGTGMGHGHGHGRERK